MSDFHLTPAFATFHPYILVRHEIVSQTPEGSIREEFNEIDGDVIRDSGVHGPFISAIENRGLRTGSTTPVVILQDLVRRRPRVGMLRTEELTARAIQGFAQGLNVQVEGIND